MREYKASADFYAAYFILAALSAAAVAAAFYAGREFFSGTPRQFFFFLSALLALAALLLTRGGMKIAKIRYRVTINELCVYSGGELIGRHELPRCKASAEYRKMKASTEYCNVLTITGDEGKSEYRLYLHRKDAVRLLADLGLSHPDVPDAGFGLHF